MVLPRQWYHAGGGKVTCPPYHTLEDVPNLHKGKQGRESPFSTGGGVRVA